MIRYVAPEIRQAFSILMVVTFQVLLLPCILALYREVTVLRYLDGIGIEYGNLNLIFPALF